MARVILVPLDGSKVAEEVLPHVEDLASSLKADVLLLQVIDEPRWPSQTPEFPSLELARETAEFDWAKNKNAAVRYLSALTEAWRAKNIYTSWRVVEGRPAEKIVEVARMRGASLVAMSTHARSGIRRVVYGSVANEVVKRLDGVPVLLIRAGQPSTGAT